MLTASVVLRVSIYHQHFDRLFEMEWAHIFVVVAQIKK
jgi:hypothetical protein